MRGKNTTGRIGAFIAFNSGHVEACAANVLLRSGCGGAGFVYENSGTVKSSVTFKSIRGKNSNGFYKKNSGTVSACGYLADPGKRTEDKNGNVHFHLGNPECFIANDTAEQEIADRLGLTKAWKRPANNYNFLLVPDIQENMVDLLTAGREIRKIGNADEWKAFVQAVNSGDRAAARADWQLTDSIDLHGEEIEPIGLSESHPFSGSLDGNGKTIKNFRINCDGREYCGVFGYTKDAIVANLTLDYIMKGKNGITTGGMVGCASGGLFENCHVYIGMTPCFCSGGFAGKNSATVKNCYVCGKVSYPVPLFPFLATGAAVVVIMATITSVMLVRKLRGDVGYTPEVIDPNQVPVTTDKTQTKDDPLPSGSNRISMELNQEIYIKHSTMVGAMNYVNPPRSTQDVVIRICISDAQLIKTGYDPVACGVRTAEEVASTDYDPAKAYTTLYQSGRVKIGYQLDNCKLSALPNGEFLRAGDYEMIVAVDAYDPVTFEKSIVNAQAAATVHILDQ